MFINHQSPMISSVSLGLLLGLLPLIFCGQPPPPKYIERYDADWQSLDRRPLPEWYDDAKIGIFIHWGVYSVPSFGSEWFWYNWRSLNATKFVSFMARNYPPGFTYGDFAHDFTAEFFNPDEWSSLFVDAGARYVVVTSKHHDGYALWPSSYSFQWNSMAIGPKRNLLRELCESTRKHGLRFGLYHSLYEWFNPLYLMDKRNGFRTQKFVYTKILPEMYELINKFQPEIFWSDGEWEAPDTYWNSTEFIQWLYNDSPVRDTVVVNDRWGSNTLCKHGGYFTCKDRFDPGALQRRKWENAMTIDRHSWGYRRVANLTDYLTIDELIVTLVKTVSCGGNLLINVGPTKYGRITPIFEERLRQLGEWLKVNGEAIYETQPWSHQNDSNLMNNVWYTQSKNDSHKVYAIQCGYPTDDEGIIQLNDVDYDQIHTVRLLGTKKPVHFAPSHLRSSLIEFPRLTPNDPLRYAYAFEIVFKQK